MTENPLAKKLKDYKVILASGSPRRKKFLEELGLEFKVQVSKIEEAYPRGLRGSQISEYLARLKASELINNLGPNEILITSDTVVWLENESLAKAQDKDDALKILKKLAGKWHEVITSVCITTATAQEVVTQVTEVKFKDFTDKEIDFYIDNYQPFDKAGAYGIQEWLGLVGIEEIRGSYTNVVGLPTHLVYKTLMDMVS